MITESIAGLCGGDGDGDQSKWYTYTHPDEEDSSGNGGIFSGITRSMKFFDW